MFSSLVNPLILPQENSTANYDVIKKLLITSAKIWSKYNITSTSLMSISEILLATFEAEGYTQFLIYPSLAVGVLAGVGAFYMEAFPEKKDSFIARFLNPSEELARRFNFYLTFAFFTAGSKESGNLPNTPTNIAITAAIIGIAFAFSLENVSVVHQSLLNKIRQCSNPVATLFGGFMGSMLGGSTCHTWVANLEKFVNAFTGNDFNSDPEKISRFTLMGVYGTATAFLRNTQLANTWHLPDFEYAMTNGVYALRRALSYPALPKLFYLDMGTAVTAIAASAYCSIKVLSLSDTTEQHEQPRLLA